MKATQSYPTLCDPMDCSLPSSSVHGILQSRILEWVAIAFSRGLLDPGIEPRSPALQADSLPFEPPGKPEDNTWLVVIVQYLIIIIIFYSVEEPETM